MGRERAAAYPPPPWRLLGRVALVVAPLRRSTGARLVPPPLRLLPVWPGGRCLAMLVLGLYGEGSTLRYGEVAGLVGPVLVAGRPGGLVTSIWVDDERSMSGGRAVWALPKERATLVWRGGRRVAVEARDVTGALIVRAAWRQPRLRTPMPVAAPFVGALGAVVRWAWLRGTLRIAPAVIDLEVPPDSRLAHLGLAGHRIGLVGRLDVLAGAARDLAPGAARAGAEPSA